MDKCFSKSSGIVMFSNYTRHSELLCQSLPPSFFFGGGGGGKDRLLALFMVNISIDLNDFVYSLKDCPKA